MARLDPKIEELNSRLKNLKDKISKIRKTGVKTPTADTMLLAIPAKIQFAAATMAEKDLQSVKKALDDVEKELLSN